MGCWLRDTGTHLNLESCRGTAEGGLGIFAVQYSGRELMLGASSVRQGRGWGPRLILPQLHCLGLPARVGSHPHGAPTQNTARKRRPTRLTYIPGSLQVVARQPKVFGVLVFMENFPLNFQIFLFKQKYFFRYDYPERACWMCVYVLNSPHSRIGTKARFRGSSST